MTTLLDLGEITQGANTSFNVQFAKVGNFTHEVYGNFDITYKDLSEMKANFESNVRRSEIDGVPALPFDYSHNEGGKAAGWIKKLSIDKDKNNVESLFGTVEWTPSAAKSIRDKDFKFTSPSIERGYKDAETKKTYNIVLKGAGLTNIPFLRDMAAIHLLSEDSKKAYDARKTAGTIPEKTKLEENVTMPTIDDVMGAVAQMTPEDKRVLFDALAQELTPQDEGVQLEGVMPDMEKPEEIKKLSEKLTLSEVANKDLVRTMATMQQDLDKMKKTSEFNILLSEGKAVEAQKESFLKGDISAFAKAAVDIKLSEEGSPGGTDTDTEPSHQVKLLAEKMVKEGKETDYGKAASQILMKNPKLRAKIEEGL